MSSTSLLSEAATLNFVDNRIEETSEAELVAVIDELPNPNRTINVCDETNSKNWFIYCSGRLLEAVNIHKIFNDSKTFVDMPMIYDDIKPEELVKFLRKFFLPPGNELISCVPEDWTTYPAKLMKITDPVLRHWALDLNNIWKLLCKKIDPRIKDQESRSSLIYVPNEFIMPGGRFREFYYWDTYWIVKGLIASDMLETTRRMIENMAYIVEKYGFIPNGGRIYYLQRSQPPMLIPMVYEYYESTQDIAFVRSILPTLRKEFNFWQQHRMMTEVKLIVKIYQYRTNSNVPRPESFREDIATARDDIASTAESGWDFSTRWFRDSVSLSSLETTKILPVDLNAFMCWNMDIMEYLHERVGDRRRSEAFRDMRATFRDVMHNVFYNRSMGAWFDYNMRTKQHNRKFYMSNVTPLYTGCYHSLNQQKSERLFRLMERIGAFSYPGGVPTSLERHSFEQWDFPNGFGPLNFMMIEGLRKSENPLMQDQAYQIARKWLLSNYRVYRKTGHMWEKYNVIGTYPEPGAGGEYAVQV
uniref:Trehalase n=1 Tax=Syphacia muris TaxID=451379 RepID=A0A0N5AKP9_9BILA